MTQHLKELMEAKLRDMQKAMQADFDAAMEEHFSKPSSAHLMMSAWMKESLSGPSSVGIPLDTLSGEMILAIAGRKPLGIKSAGFWMR